MIIWIRAVFAINTQSFYKRVYIWYKIYFNSQYDCFRFFFPTCLLLTAKMAEFKSFIFRPCIGICSTLGNILMSPSCWEFSVSFIDCYHGGTFSFFLNIFFEWWSWRQQYHAAWWRVLEQNKKGREQRWSVGVQTMKHW